MQIEESWLDKLIDRLDAWQKEDLEVFKPALTQELYPYSQLFSPIRINQLTLKNRIVMGPMGNVYMADESGRPSEKMIAFLTERAKGGVALITSGIVPVGQDVDPGLTEPGNLSLFPRIDSSRTFLSGWRTLVENIHSFGARFFIQLSPGAGRVGSPLPLMTKYKIPVSSSWNPNFYLADVPCRPLRNGEVRKLVRRMGQAAADAKEVGIDGVYIHGHEGYLLDQFSNPAFNRRLIGRYKNYQQFALETVREIRDRTGKDYPIMYRIGISAALKAVYGNRLDKNRHLKRFRNERTLEQTLRLLEMLVLNGVDLIDIDLGVYDNWWLPHPPSSMPSGCYLQISRLVKEYMESKNIMGQNGLPVPIVAVGKLGYPDLAEKALRDGDCDMVMLARPLLADPDWASKAYAGRVDRIKPCIGDQEACLRAFVTGTHIQCAVNARAGFEDVLCQVPAQAVVKKKIGVIGAGPAGIEFTIQSAMRGHEIHLFEKESHVGGMLIPGSLPTIKYEIGNYLSYLQEQVDSLVKQNRIKLSTGSEINPEELKSYHFDALVVASGGRNTSPAIPGVNLSHVLQAVDLLRNPTKMQDQTQVAVIGGGSVGCEIAYWLAAERNCSVVVVEMLPYLMRDMVTANRGHLIHLLEKKGVLLLNSARLVSIDQESIEVEHNIFHTVPDPYNTWQPVLPDNIKNPLAKKIKTDLMIKKIPAELVVIATGLCADDDLYRVCVTTHAAPEIHLLGDAFKINSVHEAVKAGYQLGISI